MDAPARQPDWWASCVRIERELRAMLAAHASTAERAVVIGQGAGGDRTLVIDGAAEDLIFDELARVHAAGHDFIAISEERGEVAFGGGPTHVVIDPIDGSLNAKRGLSPHAVSIAVADGPTMADVTFAYVADLGSGEVWSARRGGGAWLGDRRLHVRDAERRTAGGKLEIVAIEAAHPRAFADALGRAEGIAHRVRQFGSIAFALCQLAAGRVDGMATVARSRSVDAAAAQLIVRESGGLVAFTAFDPPLAAPLALDARSPVIAARTDTALAALATLPSSMA